TWHLTDNELQRNWAGGDGGGCYFEDYWQDGSSVYFNRNLVNDNVALDDNGGCYVYYLDDGGDFDFIDNEFNRNTAGGDYGGLYIDGPGDGAVLRFWDNEIVSNRAGITESLFLAGQVVYTDTAVSGGDHGGLEFNYIGNGAKVDFRRNLVLSNTAYITYTLGITPVGGNYGGMYASLSAGGLLIMMDNTIAGDTAQQDHGGLGVQLADASRVVLEHNLIQANTASNNGGGLYIQGDGNSQYFLERNRVLDNTAGQSSGGIALISTDDTAPINPLWGWSVNNLVSDNGGGTSQVGVWVQNADFRSLNDTIANNTGYGILMTGTITSSSYVSNTILWGHSAPFSKTQVLTYTDRFTMHADYSDVQGGWSGVDNLNTDPLFMGSGDYHLQDFSPVIGAGNNAAAPAVDLDNTPRPVPDGGVVDMGAYEWHQTVMYVYLPLVSRNY
ncbi:MAG: hypothetical protein GY832_30410, partial [Chloroflexi bacterium]|nr:hypothetical protein [Chloroflexota bacterium]